MAKAKGLLALIAEPSKKHEDDNDDDMHDSEAGESAAEDLIKALAAKDAAKVFEACKAMIKACKYEDDED